MYNPTETAERIKAIAKEKSIVIKHMLSELDVNHSAVTSMTKRGSWISCDSIAKIADYLGVSVDYLLGRVSDRGSLTEHERAVVITYRERKDMQTAVDTLLGVEKDTENKN
ncbi:MAG: helix-turn-helix transcriptional regulator [Clostridia bacterium]|nr:helix-turn-helix transcriptional regulator [Clostridia bacterium]